jgi:tetratricopeptide (TPR) repeat protein
MSGTEQLNYPPAEILSPTPTRRKNFEHIILWMLCNNEECEWSDFTEDPIGISQSTFSIYKNRLETKGYIENIRRGYYQITSPGRERYYELSRMKSTKRKLNYPPKAILRRRNYDHWILWMLYNNNYCKWSDFLDDNKPVYINQSSLSKNLNLLMENAYVKKDNKRYEITEAGKIEYSRMLRLYDLDRQSILEEESKRIEEITKKTREFFRKYNIEDRDVKFRFLNNVLKMDYAKVQSSLDSKEDFNKILLFFSINHPNSYPEYISLDEFSLKYNIEKIVLEFHILQIAEKEIYPIKFFKLTTKVGQVFYFQAEEKIEKVLRAIVDDYVAKFTYLNKLGGYPYYTMYSLIDDISEDICDNLFHNGLRDSLREFLAEYIKYLTYKIETEKQLVDASDKLEGFIYENIPMLLQSFESGDLEHQFKAKKEHRYYLYPDTLKALASYYMKNIKIVFQKTIANIKERDPDKALEVLDSAIELEPEKIELFILKSIVICLWRRHREAIELLEEQLDKLTDGDDDQLIPIIMFISTFCHLSLGNYEKALEISHDAIQINSNHPISRLNRAFIFGYNLIHKWDPENANLDYFIEEIEETISLESNNLNASRYYQLKAIIFFELRRFDDAAEAIDTAIELKPKIIDYYFKKIHGFILNKRFKEAIEFVEVAINQFPDENKHFLNKKAYILDKMGYYEEDPTKFEESLEILDKLIELYPEDYDLLNSKVYALAYLERETDAIKLAKELVNLDPNCGNYHDSYGEVLMMFKRYKEAVELFREALNLDRYGHFVYQTFIKLGICYFNLEEYGLAKECLEQGIEHTHSCLCDQEKKEHWLEKANRYMFKIKELSIKT